MPRIVNRAFFITLPIIILLFVLMACDYFNIAINVTPSMPIGIWKESGSLQQGDAVSLCLPDTVAVSKVAIERSYFMRGKCNTGFSPLLKYVVGFPGDEVRVTMQSVSVNGKVILHSASLAQDSSGREMPHFLSEHTVLEQDEYFVLSTHHKNSFDSRYFGVVKASWINTPMTPVYVYQ